MKHETDLVLLVLIQSRWTKCFS